MRHTYVHSCTGVHPKGLSHTYTSCMIKAVILITSSWSWLLTSQYCCMYQFAQKCWDVFVNLTLKVRVLHQMSVSILQPASVQMYTCASLGHEYSLLVRHHVVRVMQAWTDLESMLCTHAALPD